MEYAHSHLQAPARYWTAPSDIEEFLVCETLRFAAGDNVSLPDAARNRAGRFIGCGAMTYWQTFEINQRKRTAGDGEYAGCPAGVGRVLHSAIGRPHGLGG